MRKKVQYSLSTINFIVESVITLMFAGKPMTDVFLSENRGAQRIIVVLIAFLPIAYVVLENVISKKFKDESEPKVFGIIFIVLLFLSWIMCIYANARTGRFQLNRLNWILITMGCLIMYISNSFTSINNESVIFNNLKIKIKNEYVFKKFLRMSVYSVGIGGYVITLMGAIGLFFKHWAFETSALIGAVCFVIIFPFVFLKYTDKKVESKKKPAKKGIH